MSTIAEDVQQIRQAIYGREVREAIADGIEQCYSDVSSGVTRADSAASSANTAAQRANTAAAAAEEIPGTASLEDINDLKSASSLIGADGEYVTSTPIDGYYLDADGNIKSGSYSQTGFKLIRIGICGPTEILFSGHNYSANPSLCAYKRDGTIIKLADGGYKQNVVIRIYDPEIFMVAGCCQTYDGTRTFQLKCKSLLLKDRNVTYLAKGLRFDSPPSTWFDTGITWDFARPLYVRITNASLSSSGYFGSSIRQNDVSKQDMSRVLLSPGNSITQELFDVNASGAAEWMGANQYFTDYEWEVYAISVNGLPCTIDIYYFDEDEPLKTDEKGTNIIYVDANATLISHGGAFNNICNAIAYAKSKVDVNTVPVTIFVRKGTYTLQPIASRNAVIDKGANKISIIGEDRNETVIVLNSTPALNNKIIEHGGPSVIAHLTFKNLWTEDGSTIDYAHNAYCIHNDLDFSTSEDYETIVKDCYLYSEAFAPIGAGLHNHQTQVYKDCVVVFNSKDDRPQGYNQWAPIYIHAIAGGSASDVAGVEIDSCTCIAQKGTKAITLPYGPSYGGTHTYATVPVTIRRTIGHTNGSTITDIDSRYQIQPGSELNNVEAWNYSHYHQ